ncbi:DUF3987 domain-containing protein [Methylosinus trichosporium]|nr:MULTISPECIES: YfjI family protein [Methylosinus]
MPVPSDAPPAPATHSSLGRPSGRWGYRDANGDLLFEQLRFDPAGKGKVFQPLTLWRTPRGALEWRWKGVPEPRPLYGGDRLAARPDAPVIVCEGEKSADAAGRLLPDYVAVTSMNGADNAGKADWSALRGRRVVIWPDADEKGARYADAVAALSLAAGATSVAIVDLPEASPKGADAADFEELGGAPDAAAEFIADATLYTPPERGEAKASADTKPEEARASAWPEMKPLGSSLPPVSPLAPELLPEAIRDYVFDVADRQQAPPDFGAIAALCGLASIVGNIARIRPKQYDDWEVVPTLWGAIVGRPSAMKSPMMRAALAPAYALQDALRKEWETAQRAADIEGALSSLDAKEAGKRAAKALKGGDREEARRVLAEHARDGEDEAPCPRLIVNDATVEKLGELMNENPRGLLLIRDELHGFLARMEAEEYQSERAFYLEAFNGDSQFTYDRIGRGTIHIENCTLSIIGGIQPSRISPLVKGAMTGERDDGLIQRLQLAVWPDDIGSWAWSDRSPDALARKRFDDAFRDLHEMAKELTEPAVFNFSPEAQNMFRQWVTEIQLEARAGKLPSVMESHLLKMPKTVASLALIFHLADNGRGAISAEATARALDFADYLRSHANRLYSAGAAAAENGAKLIVERRAQLPQPFTARHVHQKAWAGLADRDAVGTAIDLLIESGYCREVPVSTSTAGGRPTIAYAWNPALGTED